MSTLLAIESSTKDLSLALFEGKKLIEEVDASSDLRNHSVKLLPLIDFLLKSHQLTLDDLRSIVVAGGPGSFTSLRVGLSTVLGLTVKRQIKIYTVSSLQAMALTAETEGLIAPVLRAGRGLIYSAVFEGEKMMIPDSIFWPDDFSLQLQSFKKKVHLLGEGASLVPPFSKSHFDLNFRPKASRLAQYFFVKKPEEIQMNVPTLHYLQDPTNPLDRTRKGL